ncbi:MAG TPA: NAD-dependent epimerase/dehydratase family protein [Longimicrobiales bacterium]|nr:NAD-dependent epimerase/dehydratase family protein [Longimicrobiales bacterium]
MSSRLAMVTGATGFVGSHLVDALRAESVPIRAVVRATSTTQRLVAAGVEVVVADLADAAALAEAMRGVSVVYHLAAATRARGEAEYTRANVETTAALMRAARARSEPPRVVHLGSLAAVGPTADGRPVDEDAAPRPLTAYGRTKLAGERIALGTEGVPVVALRPPTVYGPRDRDLLTIFRMAARGLMPIPGGPDRPVQMIHVLDLVVALRAAADSPHSHRVYHVAEPVIRPWSEVADMVARAVGTDPVRVRVPHALLRGAAALSEAIARLTGRATIFNRDKVLELIAPGWICTTERAERELGFRAAIPLERGIPETAAWYRTEGWLSAAK